MIIDDIPLKSIVAPPPAMVGKEDSPGFVGHNSMKPSLCFFEFKLTGVVLQRSLNIEPDFYRFPNPLLIGKTYVKEFKIRNYSEGVCSFKIEHHNTNSKDLTIEMCPLEYTLSEGEEKVIKVNVSSDTPGKNKKSSYII